MKLSFFLMIVLLIVLYSLPSFAEVIDPGKPVHGVKDKGLTTYTCWRPKEGLVEFCVFYKR